MTQEMLGAGRPAPDFSLPAGPDRRVSLAEYRGRPVVLVFYPADFSPVCSDQIGLYSLASDEFARYGASVLGISVDGIWCHRAFSQQRAVRFPLLSDFEPKGEVARRYGVYDFHDGTAARALFVLDPAGTITWSYLSPPDVNPGADGILAALDEMTARQVSR